MLEKNKKVKEKHRVFDYNSKSYFYYMEKIFDVAVLSLLWLVFCLPIVTIGASTTALYYTVHKVIMQDRGYLSQEFVRAFRDNLKRGTILWLILGIASFALQLNIGILYKKTEGYVGLFFIIFYIVLLVLVIGVMLYSFPVLSRFDMEAGWILKLAIYMTFRYFPVTLVLLSIFVAGLYVLYRIPLLVIFLPVCMMMGEHYFLESVLQRHTAR
jgi:Predicted integral membrane protein